MPGETTTGEILRRRIALRSPRTSSEDISSAGSSRDLTAAEVTAADEMIMERAEDLADDGSGTGAGNEAGNGPSGAPNEEDNSIGEQCSRFALPTTSSVGLPQSEGAPSEVLGMGSQTFIVETAVDHEHSFPSSNPQHFVVPPMPKFSPQRTYSSSLEFRHHGHQALFTVGARSLQRDYGNNESSAAAEGNNHGSSARGKSNSNMCCTRPLLPRANVSAVDDGEHFGWLGESSQFPSPTPQSEWRMHTPTVLRDCRRKAAGARATRQRQFIVVEISLGRSKRHFIQTPELLRLVHAHNYEGRIQEGKAGSLKLRDLRQICSQSPGGQRASIELRRNCILFNMCGVKCIVMHEKVILIPRGFGNSARTSPFVGLKEQAHNQVMEAEEEALIQKLIKITELRSVGGHFEFAVLESLLVEICSFLTDELSPIVQEADMMRDLTGGRLSSVLRLREISEFKRRLDSLCDRLRGASEAIQELLDNEEDLRRLELTRFWLTPEEWENPRDTPASEDAEMLLECYEQELESMLRQATRIDESLDDALQIVQLRLASIRNAFLKSELGLDIVGTVVGCVGAIAGIFGMNVPNGWEENPNVFWPMTQVMLMLCGLTAALVIIMFRRVQL